MRNILVILVSFLALSTYFIIFQLAFHGNFYPFKIPYYNMVDSNKTPISEGNWTGLGYGKAVNNNFGTKIGEGSYSGITWGDNQFNNAVSALSRGNITGIAAGNIPVASPEEYADQNRAETEFDSPCQLAEADSYIRQDVTNDNGSDHAKSETREGFRGCIIKPAY